MPSTILKPALAAAFLLLQASPGTQRQEHQHFERSLTLPPGPAHSLACATLDAGLFAHAAPTLKDLRLYPASPGKDLHELPYVVTLSEPLQQESEDARVLNLTATAAAGIQHLSFDLAMPARPYTSVVLNLNRKDFIATANVTGETAPGAAHATPLGTFTLFDLSARQLGRSTSLPLVESTYPYLHLDLKLSPTAPQQAPAALTPTVTVPPSREAQSLYTTTAQTSSLTHTGSQTVATFNLPTHVPVERITFILAPSYKGNFSRTVQINAQALPGTGPQPSPQPGSQSGPRDTPESLAGTILRVHSTPADHDLPYALAYDQLSIPVALGSNMQQPANLTVAVDGEGTAALPLAAVRLEMRQRRLCFQAPADRSYTLFYGDAGLDNPTYDTARLVRAAATPPVAAQLGPEQRNPAFHPRAAASANRHAPHELLWILWAGLLCAFATAALRFVRNRAHGHKRAAGR